MMIKFSLPTNTPPEQDARALWQHFSATYFSLRLGLAALALAFPVVLYLYGKLRHDLELQTSMSAYFWAATTAEQCAAFPMRTIFVGFLFAIGVGLFVYKGFTRLENALLNIAGICAALVAIFPEQINPTDPGAQSLFANCRSIQKWAQTQPEFPIHAVAAVTLFVLLAVVAWACADKTLEYAPDNLHGGRFRRAYKTIAVAMILFPLPGLAVAYGLGLGGHKVFFIEAAGVLTFGTYWAFKTRELWLSRIESEPDQAVRNALARARRRAASVDEL